MTVRTDGYVLRRNVAPVTDAEVRAELDAIAEQYASWDALDTPPAARDRVRCTIAFRTAGADTEYDTYEEHLILAGGKADPAFERLLGTMRTGEQRHEPALAMDSDGRSLDVRLTVHAVERMTPAPITPALVRRISGCRTVPAFLRRLRARLAARHEREATVAVRDQLSSQLAAAHPDVTIDLDEVTALVERARAESFGLLTEDQDALVRRRARIHVTALALLDRIVVEQQLDPTPADLSRYLAKLATARRTTTAEIRRDMDARQQRPAVLMGLGRQKALAFLLLRNPPVSTTETAL